MTTATRPATQPLRDTLGRLTTLYPAPVTIGAPDRPEWVSADDFFAPNSPQLRRMLAAVATAYQTELRDLPASFFFHRYNWMVACITIGAYLLDRRLPDLSLPNVAIHVDGQGQGDKIALRSGRFWTTAADPAAAHPEALVDPAGSIDLGRVRTELERHFNPVIDAMRANAPFGKRAMWLSLADNAAWCFLEYGRRLNRPGIGAAIDELLQAPDSRMRGGTHLVTVEARGGHHQFVSRGSCCLSYKLPDADYCATCPLLKPDQRLERLRQYVEAES